MRNRIIVLVSFLCSSVPVFSQTDSVPYSREYEFREGIYLTVEQFKADAPVTRQSVITSIPKNELDFFKQLTEQKKISYADTNGNEQIVEISGIWGYCQNRSVYINLHNEFNKLNVIGTICHFTAAVKTNAGYRDPMSYSYGINTTVDEIRQFVLDTKSNKVYEFDVKNMEQLLKRDSELYTQFMVLKKRNRANSIFVYLRKYNEKHPLYLPLKKFY